MHWTRVKNAEGEVFTGVVEDGVLHPCASLGSNKASGTAISMANVVLLPPCVPSNGTTITPRQRSKT